MCGVISLIIRLYAALLSIISEMQPEIHTMETCHFLKPIIKILCFTCIKILPQADPVHGGLHIHTGVVALKGTHDMAFTLQGYGVHGSDTSTATII